MIKISINPLSRAKFQLCLLLNQLLVNYIN